jgi:hypothetical protein
LRQACESSYNVPGERFKHFFFFKLALLTATSWSPDFEACSSSESELLQADHGYWSTIW